MTPIFITVSGGDITFHQSFRGWHRFSPNVNQILIKCSGGDPCFSNAHPKLSRGDTLYQIVRRHRFSSNVQGVWQRYSFNLQGVTSILNCLRRLLRSVSLAHLGRFINIHPICKPVMYLTRFTFFIQLILFRLKWWRLWRSNLFHHLKTTTTVGYFL